MGHKGTLQGTDVACPFLSIRTIHHAKKIDLTPQGPSLEILKYLARSDSVEYKISENGPPHLCGALGKGEI